MVTVDFTYNRSAFCLSVYGHARSAPKGEDLVCCAASTLIYTAAQNAMRLYEQGALQQFPDAVLVSGNGQVSVKATAESKKQVEQMFRTIAVGFDMLARQYPDYVKFREKVKR